MTHNPPRIHRERFTMLVPREPNALSAEQRTWPVIPLADEPERFTPLAEPQPATNTPEPDDQPPR